MVIDSTTAAGVGHILSHIPPWSVGVGFLIVSTSAALCIPFALRRISLLDWLQAKITGKPLASQHLGCPHISEAKTHAELYGEWRRIDAAWKINYMREVMEYGERTLDIMVTRLKDIYRPLLASHNVGNDEYAADYEAYSKTLERFRLEMRDRFRTHARENGYAQMSDADFREYLLVKPDAMMSHAGDIFDIYHRSSIVTRAEVREANGQILGDIRDKVISCFVYARGRALHWDDVRRERYGSWAAAHRMMYGRDPVEQI